MLSKALMDIDVEKTGRVQKFAKGTDEVKADLKRIENDHANAEAAVKVINADAKQKEAALDQSVALLQPSKLAVEKAESDLQCGDAQIGAAAMESEQLRAARAQMCDISEEATLARLQELCAGFVATPESFENVTLLEGEICRRLATLSDTISKAALGRVALAAELKVAQASLDAANHKQKSCAVALAQTQSERNDRISFLKVKAQTLKHHKTIVAQRVRTWHAAQKNLADFQKGARAAFQDFATEIEKQHGICILGDSTAIIKERQSSTAEAAIVAELEKDMKLYCGSPVIDRRQRQAVIRRRSAALPSSSFARLSLMARRSSMVARPASVASQNVIPSGDMGDAAQKSDTDEDTGMEAVDRERKRNVVEVAALAELEKDMKLYQGSPVIDRCQRQAVIRRRSAALPDNCFARLSLMARRSSMLVRPPCMGANDAPCAEDIDDEGIAVAADSVNKESQENDDMDQVDSETIDAMDVPTPNRSFAASDRCSY
jgi:hypothetical protein